MRPLRDRGRIVMQERRLEGGDRDRPREGVPQLGRVERAQGQRSALVLTRRCAEPAAGEAGPMFLFFSNRLGCLGSLLVSAVITVVLLLVLKVI
jgi:hypothetical protein